MTTVALRRKSACSAFLARFDEVVEDGPLAGAAPRHMGERVGERGRESVPVDGAQVALGRSELCADVLLGTDGVAQGVIRGGARLRQTTATDKVVELGLGSLPRRLDVVVERAYEDVDCLVGGAHEDVTFTVRRFRDQRERISRSMEDEIIGWA
jgi:hypothetical protein